MVKYSENEYCLDAQERKKALLMLALNPYKLGATETRLKWKLAHETEELARVRYFNELKAIQRIKRIF